MTFRGIGRAGSAKARNTIAGTTLAAALVLCVFSARGATDRDHPEALAGAGRQVYGNHCAQCHGAQLRGSYGPALVGEKFAKSLESNPITAPQLYDFMTSHMPGGQPGTLSDAQFLQVFVYLLMANHYPLGDAPISKATLETIKLLPYPRRSRGTP